MLRALREEGYTTPTPIQLQAIPPVMAGSDLLGIAQTGTGKTAAFALPMLQTAVIDEAQPNRPHALVLVPTRELAMQVAEALHRYGREKHASVLPIYGGQHIGQQLRALKRGADVVVATPGRALDHVERGTLDLGAVRVVVLDEADEMLDMGFAEDIEAILERTPSTRQTALFSATLPRRILGIAEKHLRDPVRIAIAQEKTVAGEVPRVRQVAYIVARAYKHAALGRVLDMESPTSAIVFCHTRLEVDELVEAMNARGYRAEGLHGGFAQEQRDRVMTRFRNRSADLLIATDVAARGLDVQHVSHVFNYDVPSEAEAYVHRIGRTGRAGREGVAITFVEPRQHRLLRNIQQSVPQKIAVETLPTVADLRNRRLERTRTALREAVQAGELDTFRQLVVELSEEFDVLDVAAAAVKVAHLATHEEDADGADDEDIPAPPPPPGGPRSGPAWRDRNRSQSGDARPLRRDFDPRRGDRGDQGGGRGRGSRDWDRTRLFVGIGRNGGLRPGDLVGAIANEAGVTGQAIGAIEIADEFAFVEVPADRAEHVITALKRTKIRGRKVSVRRESDPET